MRKLFATITSLSLMLSICRGDPFVDDNVTSVNVSNTTPINLNVNIEKEYVSIYIHFYYKSIPIYKKWT